jgi:hypothetical protein
VRVFSNDAERVAHYVEMKLQTVLFWDPKNLNVKELKRACTAMGIDTTGMIEREEMESVVAERRGTACSICTDEFVTGESVKVTKCGHWFHRDCLSQYARAKASAGCVTMPMCPMRCGPLDKRPERLDEVDIKSRKAEVSARRVRARTSSVST